MEAIVLEDFQEDAHELLEAVLENLPRPTILILILLQHVLLEAVLENLLRPTFLVLIHTLRVLLKAVWRLTKMPILFLVLLL